MPSSSVTPSPKSWCPTADTHFRFVCPGCQRDFEVDLDMYRSMLDEGCVFCGATPSVDAFSPV